MAIAEAGCPSEYVCLRRMGAIALGEWVGEAMPWMVAAWARCGPVPTAAGVDTSAFDAAVESGSGGVTAADAASR